jgi:transcriptional regulator with XRE-family HTH domain
MQHLIDNARATGMSDAEIARRCGVTPSYLCDAIAGRKKLSPETAALLADLAGNDARDALAAQAVRNAKPGQRDKLQRALFGCWAVGAALALSAPNSDARTFTDYTLCAVLALALLFASEPALRSPASRHGGCAPIPPGAVAPPRSAGPPRVPAFQCTGWASFAAIWRALFQASAAGSRARA